MRNAILGAAWGALSAELAKADQLTFRSLVATMDADQKSLLEEVLRSAGRLARVNSADMIRDVAAGN
jgi:hypothetical protein